MSTAQKISSLWIVVMINMVFADILSFMYPGFLSQIISGTVEGVTITPAFLLLAAVLIEVGILMIYFTRALKRPVSRVLNIVVVIITIGFVIGGGSLTPHYIFFASIEVIAMLYIAFLAWGWRED